MKKSFFIISVFVLTIWACEDQLSAMADPSACGSFPHYLKENSAIISDPYQVVSASISGPCLTLEVSAGGCDGASWEGELFIFPDVAESYPPQIQGEFTLTDRELCEALVKKQFVYDLTEVGKIADKVYIHLAGWQEPLLFTIVDAEQIIGKWSLVHISGGLMGLNRELDRQDITLEFDQKTVTVENNIEDTLLCFDSGVYKYLLDQFVHQHQVNLVIGDTNLGLVTKLSSDSLVVDQRAVDGFQYVLVK